MAQRYSDSYGDKEKGLSIGQKLLAGIAIAARQNETSTYNPEKNGVSRKLTAVASIIALSAIILSGCGSDTSKATNPNQPTATATAGETQKQPIPTEAKSFVDKYGSRYADPVATYYAEKGYKEGFFQYGSMVTDDFVKDYELTNMQDGTNAQLGFETFELPATTENSQDTALNVFNSYTAPTVATHNSDQNRYRKDG